MSRPDLPDTYIGWGTNTKPALDPKIGPKTKVFFSPRGSLRPYLGGEIIHKEELLLGLGVIYYASNQVSLEFGYRDSVYQDSKLLEEYRNSNDQKIDPWDEMNPVFYIGGVLRF